MEKLKEKDQQDYPGAAEDLGQKPTEKAVKDADKKLNYNPRNCDQTT